MVEKEIEHKESSSIVLKLVSLGFDGVPDFLVPLSGGKLCFVEVKALGKIFKVIPTGCSSAELSLRKALWNNSFQGRGGSRWRSYLKVSFREKFLKKNSHIRTY